MSNSLCNIAVLKDCFISVFMNGSQVYPMCSVTQWLEYIGCLLHFCINTYVNIDIIVFYIFPIVLALCLMLSMTCCSAGMMDGSLMATAACFVAMWHCYAQPQLHV